MQPGCAQGIDAAARRTQGADRRLGIGRHGAQQEGKSEYHGRRRAIRQVEADVLRERHQAVLDAIHEQHQTHHHGQHAEGDQFALLHVGAQRGDLEQREEQGQRHHGAQLFEEAHADIGRQQPMYVEQTQTWHMPLAVSGVGMHVPVAHAALLDPHGAKKLAIAQAAWGNGFGH